MILYTINGKEIGIRGLKFRGVIFSKRQRIYHHRQFA